MNAEEFEERMDTLQSSIEAISQNQEHLNERINELSEQQQKESSAGDVADLAEEVDALRTGVKNLLENQQTLNEHIGQVSDTADMIATADGTSQQSATLTEEEVLEAAENAGDTRSKAELFGVADD